MEIKDSGNRTEYNSGMVRDIQNDKPRFDLLYPLKQDLKATMLYKFAKHMSNGAKKYTLRNWEKANSLKELFHFRESARRHLEQYLGGEVDEDHLSAVLFNLQGVNYLCDLLKCDVKGNKIIGTVKDLTYDCTIESRPKKKKKSTKAVVKRRILELLPLIPWLTRSNISKYVKDKTDWNISERQIDYYIQNCNKIIEKQQKKSLLPVDR